MDINNRKNVGNYNGDVYDGDANDGDKYYDYSNWDDDDSAGPTITLVA